MFGKNKKRQDIIDTGFALIIFMQSDNLNKCHRFFGKQSSGNKISLGYDNDQYFCDPSEFFTIANNGSYKPVFYQNKLLVFIYRMYAEDIFSLVTLVAPGFIDLDSVDCNIQIYKQFELIPPEVILGDLLSMEEFIANWSENRSRVNEIFEIMKSPSRVRDTLLAMKKYV